MHPHLAHVFIDGGYLREIAKEHPGKLVNPRKLGSGLVESGQVQTWAYDPGQHPNCFLGRITYYDALADHAENKNASLEEYWKAIEVLDDVHLGFGALRGLKKRVRQKGVDTLIAVDMITGAFSGLFDVAILVAGDADFVPVLDEIKRRGAMAAVAARPNSISDDLRRAADRFIAVDDKSQWLQPMVSEGKSWDP